MPTPPASSRRAMLTRRSLLKRSAIVAGGSMALPGLQVLLANAANADTEITRAFPVFGKRGYGPISRKRPIAVDTEFPDAANIEWLALPEGFEYVVLGVSGDAMSDGNPTPSAHDGMGAFDLGNRRYRLVRNHESRDPVGTIQSRPIAGSMRAYDPRAGGGTTTLEIEVAGAGIPRLVRDFVSLNGTFANCAGGVTRQGSWLSCEENAKSSFGIQHGYVFEVPALAEDVVEPVAITAMGRFAHEAVAMDPRSGILYETEDAGNSGFFQYIPHSKSDLHNGTLRMLGVLGDAQRDLSGRNSNLAAPVIGEAFRVQWITIRNPNPNGPSVQKAVFNDGFSRGAAQFGRLEGCWYDPRTRSILFTCSNGGVPRQGQVWQYKPRDTQRGVLRLIYESPGGETLSGPDNLTTSPGRGILICEDHSFDRPSDPLVPLPWSRVGDDDRIEVQYMKGLTHRGEIFDFAANALDDGEWAGACFSSDGRFLFANTQGTTRGFVANRSNPSNFRNFSRTYAIFGPWQRGAFAKTRFNSRRPFRAFRRSSRSF